MVAILEVFVTGLSKLEWQLALDMEVSEPKILTDAQVEANMLTKAEHWNDCGIPTNLMDGVTGTKEQFDPSVIPDHIPEGYRAKRRKYMPSFDDTGKTFHERVLAKELSKNCKRITDEAFKNWKPDFDSFLDRYQNNKPK